MGNFSLRLQRYILRMAIVHNGTAYVGRAKDSRGETFTVTRKNLSLETFRGPASCKFHHKNNE